jgi:hypothetical protein
MPPSIQLNAQDMEFFRVDFLLSIANLLKNPSRWPSERPRAIYLVLKTASRDAEEVVKVSSYISWDSISSTICLSGEPAISIVNSCGSTGPQERMMDYGTGFGCILIQSNGLISHFEIKGCCIRDFFN